MNFVGREDFISGDIRRAAVLDRRPTRLEEIERLRKEALSLQRLTGFQYARAVDWCERAHEYLVDNVNSGASVAKWRELILPFFLRSKFLQRCHAKPRGYAGDYLMIQMMYDSASRSETAFGRAVDLWAMNQPCPRAVRNRRGLVRELVQGLKYEFEAERLSIVSLGCGPAAEVFDCLPLNGTQFHLLDIDPEAISYVQQKADTKLVGNVVRPMLCNVIKLALRNDETISSASQHAFYSLGVIDYFSDELVVRLLDYIHGKLKSGGVALLGNFRPGHPNEAFFTHALEWPLTLRSEEQLASLVAQSRFKDGPFTIGAEQQGVQLFVKCIKA